MINEFSFQISAKLLSASMLPDNIFVVNNFCKKSNIKEQTFCAQHTILVLWCSNFVARKENFFNKTQQKKKKN